MRGWPLVGALGLCLAAVSCRGDDVGPRSSIDASRNIVLHADDSLPTRPAVTKDGRSWNANQLREPGNAVQDPLTGRWILTYSGQSAETGATRIGASYSNDGLTWSPDPHNPITDEVGGEDPYLVRRTDGLLYRDAEDRAIMFTEQKPGDGLDLWHSSPGSLSQWNRLGPVLAGGPDKAWDDFDRSSPVVIADGERLMMLFEGRGRQNAGEIGYATSDDGGRHWRVHHRPVVRRGEPGSWNDFSVVPDDVIKVGKRWVLFVHAARADAPYAAGRYISTDPPDRWGSLSFAELPGNPFHHSNSIMPLGADPTKVVWLDRYRSLRLASVHEQVD